MVYHIMGRRKDLSGKTFNRLTALRVDEEKSQRKTYWVCKCECGNIKSVRSDSLQDGSVKSCGCYHSEVARKTANSIHKHKMTGTRLYSIWQGMKMRCTNSNTESYERYGGRGISVCNEWLNSFEPFMEWALNNGYKKSLTIDRINNKGDYRPANCRWLNNKQQCNNRRSNIIVKYDDKEYTLMQLTEKLGFDYKVIYARYRRGDRGERLIRPVGKGRKNKRGKENNKTKITKEQAIEIKKRLKNNEVCTHIAKDMDISKYIIYDIKRNRTWNWLET